MHTCTKVYTYRIDPANINFSSNFILAVGASQDKLQSRVLAVDPLQPGTTSMKSEDTFMAVKFSYRQVRVNKYWTWDG